MEESSRPVLEGDLYTVEQRLDTFQSSHWPYESGTCVPLKVRAHVKTTDLNLCPFYVRLFCLKFRGTFRSQTSPYFC